MASTMLLCCAVRILVLLWAQWVPDAAIEVADVVLMDDDPLQIPKAVKISRKCLRIVYQNIVLSIVIKLPA